MHTVLEITRPSAGAYDRLPKNRHNGRHQVDTETIERAVKTILEAVREDPQRPGLLDTPRRVAKMYREMFSGFHQDPARHLKVTFPESYDEMVLEVRETDTSVIVYTREDWVADRLFSSESAQPHIAD